MKKLVSILICSSILLSMCSCASQKKNESFNESGELQSIDFGDSYSNEDSANQFTSVNDADLLTYMEDVVYYDLVDDLDSDEYCVEDVKAMYVSQEYIEEMTYNSQENIYFGYHLSDIRDAFEDTPWFFTVDESGQTVVTKYEYKEFEWNFWGMLRDITIGTGVILVCATISLVTAPALPAVSMITMVAAKTAATYALSSGAIAAVAGGTVTYIQTGDIKQSLQSAMDSGGKGYKIGAITGAVAGAAKETLFLRRASANLGSLNNAARIQRETKWPADVIAEIHTMDEYRALSSAQLKPVLVGDKTALVPKDFKATKANIDLMMEGKAPLDSMGNPYELHHIGQEADATLAMLTQSQHDNIALHGFKKISEIDRNAFAKQRRDFYKMLAKILTQ